MDEKRVLSEGRYVTPDAYASSSAAECEIAGVASDGEFSAVVATTGQESRSLANIGGDL
jgi:hypothetical protein